MASSQTFTNTFVNGMVTTIDPHEQPNSTYRYAIGGRISYNRTDDVNQPLSENIKNGKTRAFTNAKGNSFSFGLCEGYRPIGSIETRQGAVVFSTNGVNSEIGFLLVNDNIYKAGYSRYTTLFNDRNDPNGDLLRFNPDYYIHGFYVYENEFTERVYWVDGYNQKRVLNLPLFYKSVGQTYHNQTSSCTSISEYPKWLSVHAFDERMDLVFPKIKFWKRIPGRLKSGQYQVVVQYVSSNGHTSVWSPLSRPVWVTTQKLDGDITIGDDTYTDAYQDNHHNRTMGASNVMTEEGQSWTLEGIDTRWEKIRVAYVYHTTSEAFQEATIYKTYDITGSEVIVDLVAHTGIGITKDELNQNFEVAAVVGATAQQENRSWDADIEGLPDMTIDLSGVSVEPAVRYYKPDNTVEPKFTAVFNPVTGRDDNDPITNSVITNGHVVKIQNFTGDEEPYAIVNDYENYKGQLFSHLYKGYFRGETQPFALVVLDRKGNRLFAQHITDYTFPEQSETKNADGDPVDWTLTRQNPDGSFDLRIMGAKFSNIKIPKNIMYDKFGKLNVSGFMIVRTKRIATIAGQGLMFNCNISPNGNTSNDQDAYVHPMDFWDNTYSLGPHIVFPGSHTYQGIVGSDYNGGGPNANAFPLWNAGNFFNFHSPDFLINTSLLGDATSAAKLKSGFLEKVGFVHKAYSEAVDIFSAHYYTKTYRTSPISWPIESEMIKNSRARLASTSRIKLALAHTGNSLQVYEKFDPETADRFDYRVQTQAFFPNRKTPWKATQQPNSVVLKTLDWVAIDTTESPTSRATYPIVNWKITPDSYYTKDDESSLDARRYFSTGHFQPITQEILDKVEKYYKANGEVEGYNFSNVEVWGGDCYNTLFDFTRMYPEYSNCVKYDNSYPDYSLSLITPIESKYNLSLIYGRSYAANCVMPQRSTCTGENDQLLNGISTVQPENWSYNEVLLLEENTQFFFPKPSGVKIVQHQPNVIRWSPKKIDGELEDSFRQKLALDYGFASGQFGRIERLLPGFSSLYILQSRAFSGLLTQLDRAVPTDTGELQIKSGDTFGGVRAISKTYGTQHRNSAWFHGDNIGFVDALMGKIIVFNQAGLDPASDTDMISDHIMEQSIYFDKTITHGNTRFVDIISGIDIENEEILTTFIYKGFSGTPAPNPKDREREVKSFTLRYNRSSGNFHGEDYTTSEFYMNIRRFLLSSNPEEGKKHQIWLSNHGKYGQYYNAYKPTILEFIVNPDSRVNKTFDNGFINVNFEGWERISEAYLRAGANVHVVSLAEQTGGVITHLDDRNGFKGNLLKVVLHEVDDYLEKENLNYTYLVVRLTIDNSQQALDGKDLQVSISNFDSKFRVRSPVQF